MKPLLEKHIQKTCTEFLALDGWRPLRTDPVSDRSRGKGFGELGMADHLYIRYGYFQSAAGSRNIKRCVAEVMWCEWKRERGGTGKKALFTRAEKAKIHQRGWIAAERARGALVLLAGEDFPATIEGFCEFYAQSGLQRRKVSIPNASFYQRNDRRVPAALG